MDLDQFWKIVDAAAASSRGNFSVRSRLVVESLSMLEGPEIIEFANIMARLLDEAYRWDLWAAAYIVNGGCGDDSFQDFRRWLISKGRQAYEGVLMNPETLPEWSEGEDDIFFEEFPDVSYDAYRVSTGRDMLNDLAAATSPLGWQKREPSGEPWRDEDLPRRFPRLFARHGTREA